MRKTKALLEAQQAYYKDCEIDPRTLPMIVHHYVSIGEQAAANLTDAKIQSIYEKAKREEIAIESKQIPGKMSIRAVTPEFEQYILVACQKLYLLPSDVRYTIIKENL